MADSKELRAIVAAGRLDSGPCEWPLAGTRLVHALLDHVDPIVELVAAAEFVAGARLGGSLELALSELDAALAAVHAVGKGDKDA